MNTNFFLKQIQDLSTFDHDTRLRPHQKNTSLILNLIAFNYHSIFTILLMNSRCIQHIHTRVLRSMMMASLLPICEVLYNTYTHSIFFSPKIIKQTYLFQIKRTYVCNKEKVFNTNELSSVGILFGTNLKKSL